MPDYALLISPRAAAAFFDRATEIAQIEAEAFGAVDVAAHGEMQFLHLTAEATHLSQLARLSCVQGIFERQGDLLRPLDADPDFRLHPDFVWGEKYRGKTNETLTQAMLNLALQQMPGRDPAQMRLLDPLCGRGTTLMWALRYGMTATGIEQDGTVLTEWRRGLKKWTKLRRQKHKLAEGWVQKTNKKGIGKYLDFVVGDRSARIVIGDSANAHDLTLRKAHDLIVTDMPYGVQHVGATGTRNPMATLEAAAPAWAKCLAPGGIMAIAFNANLPKRPVLEAAFDGLGLEVVPTDLAHRMSESILRDILILRRVD